ncbi:MAG: 50S ribosomal protein L11 methyltransferase [Saprospiraceae bacterium]|nr:50S ribosomal protein L11 methyltransferase [Saprospiraceae bacterium]MBP7699881.1 50S ribosomal protein L11 methyltransferase [Saprospiraceae bacterium]
MIYYKFTIHPTQPAEKEIVMALLSESTDEAIVETYEGFEVYAPEAQVDFLQQHIKSLQHQFSMDVRLETVENKNWNAEWEANFQPIVVDDFCCIRADFHPPYGGVRFDLIINPKMAFGTGHHETTFMMLEQMQHLDFNDKKVFDYGCGTGILAIMAAKLGATQLVANDIELPSYENTIENAEINHVTNITALLGDIHVVPTAMYDVILANINRNIIIQSLPILHQLLAPSGTMLISGFIQADADIMQDALHEHGFTIHKKRERNFWQCWEVKKNLHH